MVAGGLAVVTSDPSAPHRPRRGGNLSVFSIDWTGCPRARRAEGTNHSSGRFISAIKALVWPGRFELNDVVIEGMSKTDEPFLSRQKIVVNVTWRTLISKELFVDVDMTDWTMAIEDWKDRPSSIPKLTPEIPDGGKRFSTTVCVTASRGKFTFRDHETP